MKKFAAFLLNNKGKRSNSADAAATTQQQANHTPSTPYSMAPLEHWDLEMHNACARGLKKAFKYLEDNITPAHGKLLFQTSGLNTEVDQLINLIEDDTISSLDFSRMKSLHSLAYAILKVLSRHDPLIPSDLYDVLTSSHVDYESLLKHPRKQYLGLLEFIMNSLWRLVYEKKCDVALDQVCKTIGTVLLRPQNEGMISFDDDDMFQTPEMQLRLATFSGILRCFRVDPVSPAQSLDRPLPNATGKSHLASQSSGANSLPSASIQDRSVKLIFLDPENRPTEEQLMEVLTNFGEVANIGFKNKFAVVLFAELEPALECALENDGHALGPDIKVKYLGAKELLDSHMKHLEEAFAQSSNLSSSVNGPSSLNQQNQGLEKQNRPGNDNYLHPSSPDDHRIQHAQNNTLPAEISAIHPYAGRSMADAGDHNISLNLSTDYRHARHALDGYSSSSSNNSRQPVATRPGTAPATNGDGWKVAQRSTSRDNDSSNSSGDSWERNRPQTAPTSSTTPRKTTKSKTNRGIAFEGDVSPIPSHSSSRRNSNAQKHSPAKSQSPLQVKTTPRREEDIDSSDIENGQAIVSPPSSNSSLRRQRQIKKIHVGVSPTASSSPSNLHPQSSPFFGERHNYDHPDDDASYLEEYPSPMLTQTSRHLKETREEDANVLLSTREFPPEAITIADKNGGDNTSPAARRQSRSNSVGSHNSSNSNHGNTSRRSSAGSLLHPDKYDKPRLDPPPNEAEADIVSYFATKIAKSMERTHKQHDANYANSNPMPSLSKEYTSVKALFEVAEREYQDQITTLEAKCIVYQDKINQQETWLAAIEQRWQAELLQKQVHVTTLETDNRQLREEIQALKMEMQSKQARITSLETSSETLQRAVKMSKDRAQRDSLSVVLSQQQVISNLDENLEAIKEQNKRLQDEIDSMTVKHASLIGENMQWKTKVAEWELKWNQFQQELSKVKSVQPENEDKGTTIVAQPSDGEKNGKYFDGILVAAGKQSIMDSNAQVEDKEYRTMRALADHEIDEYMNNLPGRYHPVYSRDTVGIIRSETRDPNEHVCAANGPSGVVPAVDSSPPKYLKVKFDETTENMTYSERLLANMTKHYRAGYRQTQDGRERSLSPTDKIRKNIPPTSSSSGYHPFYHNQPTRNAAIAAAHMLPAASEIVPPVRSQHTQYKPHASVVPPPPTPVIEPTGPSPTLTKSLLPSNILNSPSVQFQRDTSILSPSALASSSSYGNNFNNNRSKTSYEDPMTAIKNYLAEKQLASSRADIGESMQGMRFYNHLRAQFEHIDVPANFGKGTHSSLPMSSNISRPPMIAGSIGKAVGVKDDELWKLYA